MSTTPGSQNHTEYGDLDSKLSKLKTSRRQPSPRLVSTRRPTAKSSVTQKLHTWSRQATLVSPESHPGLAVCSRSGARSNHLNSTFCRHPREGFPELSKRTTITKRKNLRSGLSSLSTHTAIRNEGGQGSSLVKGSFKWHSKNRSDYNKLSSASHLR